jgi:hypothetical protein
MITYRLRPLPGAMGFISIGQQPVDWTSMAQAAISRYDVLVKRLSQIKDDAVRSDILEWLGEAGTLGAPSERYQAVRADLASAAPWDTVSIGQVQDLQAVDGDFETKVSKGEQSGTYTSTSPVAIVTPQGQLSPLGIGLLAGAAACLVVVPLFVLK